jgi:hypothetical protein
MAVKRSNIYLILALLCLLGIILIFLFDGYMGIYDSLSVTTGEREEKIAVDYNQEQEWYPSTVVAWGEEATFHYEVDNRCLSGYAADVEVTVWHSQEKVADLLSRPLTISPFGKGEAEFLLDTALLLPSDAPPEQGYEFTVVIRRGEVEWGLFVHVAAGSESKSVLIDPWR